MAFTHLHLHTEYSLLDGAIRLKDLAPRLKELGMDACAITDHGVLYGTVDFYRSMKAAGIKPILGCEAYVAPRTMTDREGSKDREPWHLVLLAETQEGWHNLMKLCSLAFTEGFYYRPRIDFETLSLYHEGLICLSACLGGEIPRRFLDEGYESAKAAAIRYDELFGRGQFYLEVQSNTIAEQAAVNSALVRISEETGIPIAATNDCHYLLREDAYAQDILLCMQTGKRQSDEQRMHMDGDSFYLKSPAEMEAAFKNLPEAILNTERIAARCHAEIEFGKLYLPEYKPETGETAVQFIRRLCLEGLEERLQIPRAHSREDYLKRLEQELQVIDQMGYSDYFLIVWDYIRFAREREILVGPGRGSGGGSLAAYCLKITNVDPLEFDLLFERFLNPERVSLPDFDIDFCDDRRGELIDYVSDKYGRDHVCQVITFGTLGAKQCVRDVARALDYPYAEADRIAKMIPGMSTIEAALEQSQDLREDYKSRESTTRLIDLCRRLEGMPRHSSTHAAGVIISAVPISDVAPLAKNDEAVVVQYTKDNIESVGLLKFDFLGLRTLSVLRDTRAMLQETRGINVDFDSLSFDDPKVFEMLGRGETAGVFQLEQAGMTKFIKEMKPSSMEDIIAGISLYRPGPMEQIPRYIAAADPAKVKYDHPLLEPILKSTRGCFIYQEQVMQIVRSLAGFSMGQADNVRRAMSKKKPEVLARYKSLFIDGGQTENGAEVKGAVANGVPRTVAENIFEEVMAFAGYAFNKSHAAGYAVLAYQTAWLKCHYPLEFMAATLNSFLGALDKAAQYIRDCKDMGIDVLKPDINHSETRFSAENGAIRFALGAVKNLGINVVETIISERRKKGQFLSFGDFVRRISNYEINKKVIESLIKSSALDCFGIPRSHLIAVYEPYMQQVVQSRARRMEGQLSLFDLSGAGEIQDEEPIYPKRDEFTEADLLAQEKEMLGLYVSGHPLDAYSKVMSNYCTLTALDLKPDDEINSTLKDRMPVVMAGQLLKQRLLTTKKQEQMAFLTMEDLTGSFEVIVFPSFWQIAHSLFQEGSVLLFQGSLSLREDEDPKLLAEACRILNPTESGEVPPMLQVPERKGRNGQYGERKNGPSYSNKAQIQTNAVPGGNADYALSQGTQALGETKPPAMTASPDIPSETEVQIRASGPTEAAGAEIHVLPSELRLAILWPETETVEARRVLLDMLAFFNGRTEVILVDPDGDSLKSLGLEYALDLTYLALFEQRYGAERFALI